MDKSVLLIITLVSIVALGYLFYTGRLSNPLVSKESFDNGNPYYASTGAPADETIQGVISLMDRLKDNPYLDEKDVDPAAYVRKYSEYGRRKTDFAQLPIGIPDDFAANVKRCSKLTQCKKLNAGEEGEDCGYCYGSGFMYGADQPGYGKCETRYSDGSYATDNNLDGVLGLSVATNARQLDCEMMKIAERIGSIGTAQQLMRSTDSIVLRHGGWNTVTDLPVAHVGDNQRIISFDALQGVTSMNHFVSLDMFSVKPAVMGQMIFDVDTENGNVLKLSSKQTRRAYGTFIHLKKGSQHVEFAKEFRERSSMIQTYPAFITAKVASGGNITTYYLIPEGETLKWVNAAPDTEPFTIEVMTHEKDAYKCTGRLKIGARYVGVNEMDSTMKIVEPTGSPSRVTMSGVDVRMEFMLSIADLFEDKCKDNVDGNISLPCLQQMHTSYGCSVQGNAYPTSINYDSHPARTKSIADAQASAQEMYQKAMSPDLALASEAYPSCFGKEISPCLQRRPDEPIRLECIQKLFKDSGCNEFGTMYPANQSDYESMYESGMQAGLSVSSLGTQFAELKEQTDSSNETLRSQALNQCLGVPVQTCDNKPDVTSFASLQPSKTTTLFTNERKVMPSRSIKSNFWVNPSYTIEFEMKPVSIDATRGADVFFLGKQSAVYSSAFRMFEMRIIDREAKRMSFLIGDMDFTFNSPDVKMNEWNLVKMTNSSGMVSIVINNNQGNKITVNARRGDEIVRKGYMYVGKNFTHSSDVRMKNMLFRNNV